MKKEGHQNTRVQVGAQNKKMYPAVTNIKKQVSDKPFKKTQLVPEVPGIEKKTKKKNLLVPEVPGIVKKIVVVLLCLFFFKLC